jgi:hypothetical protein
VLFDRENSQLDKSLATRGRFGEILNQGLNHESIIDWIRWGALQGEMVAKDPSPGSLSGVDFEIERDDPIVDYRDPYTFLFHGYFREDLRGCYKLDLDYTTTVDDFFSAARFLNLQYQNSKKIELFLNKCLLEFRMPGLERVSGADLVALREKSEGFYEYREFFSEVAATLLAVEDNGLDEVVEEAEYLINHKLTKKHRDLKQELQRNSLKEHLKKQKINFGISFLGLAIASGVMPLSIKELIMLGLSSHGPLGVLSYYLQGKHKEKQELETFSKFCLVFEEI